MHVYEPEQVSIFDLEPDRGVRSLRGLSAQSSLVAFSKSGELVAALAHNWELGIWNLTSNRLERVIETPRGMTADNAGFAFSADERHLLFATAREARLWEWRTGTLTQSWTLPLGLQQKVWFDAEGRMFLFQWDSDSQEKLAQLTSGK